MPELPAVEAGVPATPPEVPAPMLVPPTPPVCGLAPPPATPEPDPALVPATGETGGLGAVCEPAGSGGESMPAVGGAMPEGAPEPIGAVPAVLVVPAAASEPEPTGAAGPQP